MDSDLWLNGVGLSESELTAALRGDRHVVGVILSREQAETAVRIFDEALGDVERARQ